MDSNRYDGVYSDMIKVAVSIIIICLGLIAGKGTTGRKLNVIKKTEKCSVTEKTVTSVIESPAKCPLVIPNLGMLHNLSLKESESKLFNFFNEALKEHTDPNEFNVHTNLSPPGKSAQKHDPLEDLFQRFDRNHKTKKKIKYGVLSHPYNLEILKNCDPQFVNIAEDERLDFYKYFGFKDYVQTPKVAKDPFDSEAYQDFSFIKVRRFYSFQKEQDEFLMRFRHFKNNCNNAISKPINFCINDPRYDMQYEDMFVTDDGNKAYSFIYCKKSSDLKWTLIREFTFKLL